VADPIVFPGTVEWSGENPGISLKDRPDGPFVARAMRFSFRGLTAPSARPLPGRIFLRRARATRGCRSRYSRSATTWTVQLMITVALWQTNFFSSLAENLNYSAQRLLQIWPARFRDASEAAQVAGNPQLIAQKLYGGRLGNNDQDDAWKFRGRGYLQTTGKANYMRSSARLGIDLVGEPDRLLDSKVASREEAAYFAQLRDRRSLREVVRAINGGLTGMAEAQAILERLSPEAPKVTEGLAITPGTPPSEK
jgi:putative chitinase